MHASLKLACSSARATAVSRRSRLLVLRMAPAGAGDDGGPLVGALESEIRALGAERVGGGAVRPGASGSSFYDLQQRAESLVNRHASRGRQRAGIGAACALARAFRDVGEDAAAAELGGAAIRVAKEFEVELFREAGAGSAAAGFAAAAETVIDFCGPSGLAMSESKQRLMHAALVHAKGGGGGAGAAAGRLRGACLAEYMRTRSMGPAQALAVQLGDLGPLADLALLWRNVVYPSEKHLTTLRLVLLLLSEGKVQLALDLLDHPTLGIDFDAPQLALPLQTAYLLATACSTGNLACFDYVHGQKYALVFRRDPAFARLAAAIRQSVFGAAPPPNPLMNMFQSVMMGGAPPPAFAAS